MAFKFFSKSNKKASLEKGLEKTKSNFFGQLKKAVAGKSTIDDDILDEIEAVLIRADVGVVTTIKIINNIEKRVQKDKYLNTDELNKLLKDEIEQLLFDEAKKEERIEENTGPKVILVVGVNGVGKTTTIGKLAARYKHEGKKVILGAADTFRAAAIDQLKFWGERVGVPVIANGMNSDPASVAFKTTEKAREEHFDIAIIDTAGRLHTKVNLMNELSKIKKVIKKNLPDAPSEVMLVLDGSTGQNAFIQAQEFIKATEVDTLTVTKLDGTAKGGVILGISDQLQIPIKYIGVGEAVEDLQVFDKRTFVDTFFN